MDNTLTQTRLRALLTYDPSTGHFTWNEREDRHSRWNARYSGTRAGCSVEGGYVFISIDGKPYRAHRLAFIYQTGSCPDLVDHIDGNKGHNAWSNLRAATVQQNGQNRALNQNNASGVVGVSWCKRAKKWLAVIGVNNKRIYLGSFDSVAEAKAAREKAEQVHFGEFKRRT